MSTDADWFVDPLNRFDGRFFDGTQWTDRVSDGGILKTDPDWPPTVTPVDRNRSSSVGTQVIKGRDRRERDRRTVEVLPATERRSGQRRQLDALIVPD